MRTFKFRVWDKKYEKMYNSDDVKTALVFPDKDVEIMQFTGLHDKSGKEIYEGDRVSLWYEELFFKDTVEGEIVWDNSNAQFVIDFSDQENSLPLAKFDLGFAQIEVIGNIFEVKEKGCSMK
jgi:uncharacterized phage protein (TIGR01671 family)